MLASSALSGAQPGLHQPGLEIADLALHRRQRLEHGVGHPVECHIDDVALCAPGRNLSTGDQFGQVEPVLVDGDQEVAVEEDVDA